mgnify:CR=1 FL=1
MIAQLLENTSFHDHLFRSFLLSEAAYQNGPFQNGIPCQGFLMSQNITSHALLPEDQRPSIPKVASLKGILKASGLTEEDYLRHLEEEHL